MLNLHYEILGKQKRVSERLKAASGERIKSGHFEAERLIAEAGSDGEQLRDESTQNELVVSAIGSSLRTD